MHLRLPNRLWVTGALLAMLATHARADSVDLVSVADNTLYETAAGDRSNGAGSAMFAGRTMSPTNSRRRALVRFDLSSIPAGASITGATLQLYQNGGNADPATVALHRVGQAWGEGTSVGTMGQGNGAPATPGDATWLHTFFPASTWLNSGGDFAPMASATTSVGDAGYYAWSSAQLLTDVQVFYAAPASNFGWMLIGNESASTTAKRFATREEPLVELQPLLTVTYQIPEPASISLLALAVAMACRSRR